MFRMVCVIAVCGAVRLAAQQAVDGRAVYQANCASCHRPDLAGSGEAPQLAGSNFMTAWGARPVSELISYMQSAMPPSNPGGRCGGSSIRAGHGVRGPSSIRGIAETGCPALPEGFVPGTSWKFTTWTLPSSLTFTATVQKTDGGWAYLTVNADPTSSRWYYIPQMPGAWEPQ